MNDRIGMAVLERTPNLPRKLPRAPFPQSSVGDDVVEHLAAVDVLEDHVVVVLCIQIGDEGKGEGRGKSVLASAESEKRAREGTNGVQHHTLHATNIRVMQQEAQTPLPHGPNLLALILGGGFGEEGSGRRVPLLLFGRGAILGGGFRWGTVGGGGGGEAGDDLDGDLCEKSEGEREVISGDLGWK